MRNITHYFLLCIVIAGMLLITCCTDNAKGGARYSEAADNIRQLRDSDEIYTYDNEDFILGDTESECRLVAYSYLHSGANDVDTVSSIVPLYNSKSEIVAYCINFSPKGYVVITTYDYTVARYDYDSDSPCSDIPLDGIYMFVPPHAIYHYDGKNTVTNMYDGYITEYKFGYNFPCFEFEANEHIRTYSVLNAINRLEGKAEEYPLT